MLHIKKLDPEKCVHFSLIDYRLYIVYKKIEYIFMYSKNY